MPPARRQLRPPDVHRCRTLARLMHLLAHVRLEEFLPAAMDALADPRAFGATHAAIFRIDQEHGLFLREAAIGYPNGWAGDDLPTASGIMGRAVRERRTVVVPDVTRDPDYVPGPVTIRSELAIPLCIRRNDTETIVGVLNVERSTANAFSDDEHAAFELFAEQIATYYGILEAIQSDPTTAALSVATLAPLLTTLVQDFRRNGRPGIVVFADVNGLHALNHRFTHEIGNAALRHFVAMIRATIREGDQIIRFGGDEFILLLREASDGAVLERVVQALDSPIPPTSLPTDTRDPIRVTGAFGVIPLSVFFRRHPELLEDHDLSRCLSILRAEASRTMFRAKASGSRTSLETSCSIAYYEDIDEEVEESLRGSVAGS